MKTCALCKIDPLNPKEKVYFKDSQIYVLDTLEKKGHPERIMVMVRRHVKTVGYALSNHALAQLQLVCHNAFFLFRGYYICEPKYATIPGHWHLVATCSYTTDEKERKQFAKTPKKFYDIRGGMK